MVELPALEVSYQRLQAKALNRSVAKITALEEGVLANTSSDQLRQGLEWARVTDLSRFGDFLILELDGRRVLLIHPSYTASIQVARPKGGPGPHTCFQVKFQEGGGLALDDRRRRSALYLIESEENLPKLGSFGPDPLSGALDPERWRQSLQQRRAQIRGLLLEPSLIAGLGPVFADEILFQAGIRPDRRASDLSEAELERLRRAVQTTLRKAVRCQAHPRRLPKAFLTRAREEGGTCPKCGGPLSRKRIKGRNSVLCPNCQT